MLVVAKDGNPLSPSSRYWADTLKIGPAERYDVVITADNPGPWMIHTHVSSHETNCGKAPGGMHTMLVYEEYLDKMHQFKAEAPVDCPKGETLELPSDFTNQTSFAADSPQLPGPLGQASSPPDQFTWSFPVKLACAVREMSFYVHTWQSASSVQSFPASAKATLHRPDGSTYALDPATPGNDAAFEAKEHSLNGNVTVDGDYTITLEVTGMDVKVDLSVIVDYYESFEQSKIGHLTYKVGGCPGFT
jgi:hypothetical protein